MTDEKTDTVTFREILVAIDASAHSRAALHAAMALAQITEANLKGLFVRCTEWHHISRLSFASEIGELTGEVRPLPEKTMNKQVELIENRIREMIRIAEKYGGVSPSWQSVTGSVTEQVLEAAKEADLITLGRIGHSPLKRKKLGRSARAVINKAGKPVLILQEGLILGDTIIAVYDASEQSRRALKTAIALAKKNESKLFVLVLGNDPEAIRERDQTAEKLLDRTAVPLHITFMKQPHVWQFARTVHNLAGGLLIMPGNQPLVSQHSLEELLDLLRCPLLLMN